MFSCWVVVEEFRTSVFSVCFLKKIVPVTSTKKSCCCSSIYSAQRKSSELPGQNESIAVYTAATAWKTILLTTDRSPIVDQLSFTEGRSPNLDAEKIACKSSLMGWTSRTTDLNQPSHLIRFTKLLSQNEKFVRREARPHKLSYIRLRISQSM